MTVSSRAPLGRAMAASPVCLLFALPDEAKPFQQVKGTEPSPAVRVSGMGAERAAQFAAELLTMQATPGTLLLICGFAGAVRALNPGEILIASQVLDRSEDVQADIRFRADSRLLAAAESVVIPGLTTRTGTLATVGRVLTTGAEKRAFAATSDALAVDMETAGAARTAQAKHIPWLAIRVVTDGPDDAMPLDFNQLADANGLPDKRRIVAATLAHPHKIPALIALGKRSGQAADNLARFLHALLPLLPEHAS